MKTFQPSRANGYSDKAVLFDLIKDAEPDELFDYSTLSERLSVGVEGEVPKSRVYQAIAAVNKILLKEKKRYLAVVRRKGYRVTRANESFALAKDRKVKAEVNLRKGYDILANVRTNELTHAERQLRDGSLLMFGGLCQAISESNARTARIENLMDTLVQRVDKLEGGTQDATRRGPT